MLAIIKAGGAFVPLNPSLPDSQLVSQIENVDALTVLVSAKFAGSIRHHWQTCYCRIGNYNQEAPIDMRKQCSYCEPLRIPCTSCLHLGAQAEPKGVVLEHRAVSSSIKNHGRVMGFSSTSRVFQFSACTFDASVFEIFDALCWGAASACRLALTD